MPKIVNHNERKIKIAESTWNVIVREGLENASVRKIAAEANLSVGSLRHYFPSQSDLFLFSMELVSERVRKRIEGKNYDGPPLEMFQEALSEVLPIDEDRKIEMEVWLVFSAKTLVDRRLEELSKNVFIQIRTGIEKIINTLDSLELLKENVDQHAEVIRLHALIDGLATHHILHPNTVTNKEMILTLRYHLLSLCREV
ncbi:TetR/AcrR family transcriptional regulator [Paucisalibacillus sp. EB02]|uniref:TetR/AcrR family transcriptional regulator n=1 Tax=Paucisalibacillus sp. EB02 TaxID=1347087 RepID=UPI0004AF93E8|nr:TetR family transcriptional regulator C-terminal domain-containing protein [Paucisalibacillus sp. EB02]